MAKRRRRIKTSTRIGRIISAEMHKGHKQSQAIAIAYSKLGLSRKKRR